MIISCFEFSESLALVPVEPGEELVAIRRAGSKTWLDLKAPEEGELKTWLGQLGISELSQRLLLDARDRPGFYPLKDEFLLVIPLVADTEEESGGVDYVGLFCNETLLLTVHEKSVVSSRTRAMLHESGVWLPEPTIAGIASAVMIQLSMECLLHVSNFRSRVLALEQQMVSEPDQVGAEKILEVHSDLLVLATVVADQLPSVQALTKTDRSFFKLAEAKQYMNCAAVNLQAADARLARLDTRIEALRAGFHMRAQDKTNRRLGLLTILSVIFMPLTLLAGIWGMNFETMPELKYPTSYPMAIGLMSVIGSGMYLYFRRNGWFD